MFQKVKISHLQIAVVVLLVLLSVFLLWFNNNTSSQSTPALVPQVYFAGRYQIEGENDWHEIVAGEHIPATKGDVTLEGNFYFHIKEGDEEFSGIHRGKPIMIYSNHVNLTVYDGENGFYTDDIENTLCGENWNAYYFESPEDDLIKIVVHNPHKYGNETAIDEMLSTLAIKDDLRLYEKNALSIGEIQRSVGLIFVMGAAMILGVSLFSSLIHIKNVKIIWVLGGLVLSAGVYFAYSSYGVFLWSDSVVSNTTILCFSMMLYMLFVSLIITYMLKVTKNIGDITMLILGIADAVFLILPIVTRVLIYDALVWWITIQLLANLSLAFCLVKEFMALNEKKRWAYIGACLPLAAFAIDAIATLVGIWEGGLISQCIFTVLFVISIVMIMKLVPANVNAANKARELEVEKVHLNAQLAESRISTMISQIRPHFIYNTLGSIEQLCKLDPPKAGELVHNLAKYLRGNFGELDNPKPILMSREMEHVRHYISIENVRFPDMTFTFEMNSDDFKIPALTVQPIVENAIKHGLMKLPKGGTINVLSYETDTEYCISVTDDGVGFDTSVLLDDRKHIGLRNIRERLKVMVKGTLEIESTVGVGTKVLIKIPKEV
jgi:hypothetical protein